MSVNQLSLSHAYMHVRTHSQADDFIVPWVLCHSFIFQDAVPPVAYLYKMKRLDWEESTCTVEEHVPGTKEFIRWSAFQTALAFKACLKPEPVPLNRIISSRFTHPKKKEKKHDWQTVMCLILYEINGYLLPLGLILTEVRSSRASWQFWRFLKSGRVSALQLKSQKWLKRFFLERPVLPDCIPRLRFFCLQIPWQAGMDKILTRISFVEKICMKIGLFSCQINTLDGVFCSILVTVSRKVN